MIAGHPVVLVCGTRPNQVNRDNRAAWRDFPERLTDVLYERLKRGRFLVLSGIAAGPDTWAWNWADLNWLPRLAMPADWDGEGKSAGIKRNLLMAALADECIAVWDGKSKGTAHMIEQIRKRGIPLHIIKVHTPNDEPQATGDGND